MKTFKQHVKEAHGGYMGDAQGVGTTGYSNPIEDGSVGVHNIHEPAVLERVNAFVGSIGDREYRQDVSFFTGLNSTFANNHSMYHYDGPSGSLSGSSVDSLQACFSNNYSLRKG